MNTLDQLYKQQKEISDKINAEKKRIEVETLMAQNGQRNFDGHVFVALVRVQEESYYDNEGASVCVYFTKEQALLHFPEERIVKVKVGGERSEYMLMAPPKNVEGMH